MVFWARFVESLRVEFFPGSTPGFQWQMKVNTCHIGQVIALFPNSPFELIVGFYI